MAILLGSWCYREWDSHCCWSEADVGSNEMGDKRQNCGKIVESACSTTEMHFMAMFLILRLASSVFVPMLVANSMVIPLHQTD